MIWGYHYVRKHPYYEWWFHLNITPTKEKLVCNAECCGSNPSTTGIRNRKKNVWVSGVSPARQAFCCFPSGSFRVMTPLRSLSISSKIWKFLKRKAVKKFKEIINQLCRNKCTKQRSTFRRFSRQNGGCSMATYMLVDQMCKSWLSTINLWVSWIFKFLKILHLSDSSPNRFIHWDFFSQCRCW